MISLYIYWLPIETVLNLKIWKHPDANTDHKKNDTASAAYSQNRNATT